MNRNTRTAHSTVVVTGRTSVHIGGWTLHDRANHSLRNSVGGYADHCAWGRGSGSLYC